MSLPSKALFYMRGERVGESFINCGWFWDPDDIGMHKRLLLEIEYPDCDWDEMFMYQKMFKYEDVINLVMNEV